MKVKLLEGENNFNFLLCGKKDYILRLGKKLDNWNKLEKEFEKLNLISNLGISPKPIYFQKNPVPYFLMEKLNGKKVTYNDKKVSIYINQIQKTLIKLHDFKIKTKITNKEIVEKTYNRTKEYFETNKKKLNKNQKKLIKKTFDLTLKEIKNNNKIFNKKELSLVHLDVHGDNMIINKNKIFLIDFEFSKIGDPAQDLASLFMNHPLYDKQENFIKTYCKKRKLNYLNFEKKFDIYYKLANVANIIYSQKDKIKIEKSIYSLNKN